MGERLTLECRIKALEAGQWQASDGRFVELAKMDHSHLTNAFLKALADGEDRRLTDLLRDEVARRDLQDYVLERAQERTRFKRNADRWRNR